MNYRISASEFLTYEESLLAPRLSALFPGITPQGQSHQMFLTSIDPFHMPQILANIHSFTTSPFALHKPDLLKRIAQFYIESRYGIPTRPLYVNRMLETQHSLSIQTINKIKEHGLPRQILMNCINKLIFKDDLAFNHDLSIFNSVFTTLIRVSLLVILLLEEPSHIGILEHFDQI
jgi:hypothetical protein